MKLIKHILFMHCLLWVAPLAAQVNADYFLQNGLQAYQEKNYPAAIRNFEQTLSLDTTNQQSYSLLAATYLAHQDAASSQKVAIEGLQQFKQEVNLRWLKAESGLQLGQYTEALADYELIVKVHKNDDQLPANVSQEVLQQRIAQVCNQLGQQAAERQDYASAIRYFAKVKRYFPEKEFSYVNLAFAYIKAEQWDEALQITKAGLKKFPQQESLVKAKANALYQLKDYQALEDEYRQLYQKNPDDPDIAIAYGELLMGNQKFTEASSVYDQLLRKHPNDRKIYESLLRIYESKYNYKGKLQVLKQMLPHFEKIGIYQQIAQTLETMSQWEEARQYYDTLLTFSSEDLPIKKKIGQTYLEQNKPEEAASYYEQLLKDYPEDTEILQQVAILKEQQGQWSSAIKSYEKLLAIEYSAENQARLGYVYQQLGQKGKALENYQQAIQRGNEPLAYWGAATILQSYETDSAFGLAEKGLAIALSNLQKQEKQLQKMFQAGNALGSLTKNKALVQKAKATDSITTLIFNHLASYEYSKARQSILHLTKNFSESAKMHFLIGKFYHQHQQWDMALQRLQLATQLNPNLWENQLLMGEIHQHKGENMQAMLAYERVLTLHKSNKKAHQALVKLYQQENQLDLLCDKWLARYQADQQNEMLQEHLIEALHKCGRTATAKMIIKNREDLKKDNL